MNRRPYTTLIVVVILIAFSLWINLSKTISITNPFNSQPLFTRNVETRLGLDLRGGLQALLEVPEGTTVTAQDLETTKAILESRVNALGVSEVNMQVAPPRRIVAEFPGINNPEEVVASVKQTGMLEFVDFGDNPLADGTVIKTDQGNPGSATPATDTTTAAKDRVFHTVMTGTSLQTVNVQPSSQGGYEIAFSLKSDSSKIFSDYTRDNVNKFLAIVLDKTVISAPRINSQISDGSGVITGSYTQATANTFAVQLRYGSLPVPVQVAESRTVGATLGAESVRKSLLAGAIGLGVVILFMLLYYRVPGFIADLALITYALLSLALFKLIPVVLTLPGIAGFILSIGMAVDANILIFERLKEELRSGKTLRQSIDLGWQRAWPSIRDSNSSTLITCAILYIFGNTFGASMVKGFSVTLALGVIVSLFTAIIVTRTYLHTLMDNIKIVDHPRWFGL
ncbi:MAG: protein translocase subunit SecD [Chloroflexi bacterium]|nr:protein translocase subunit SecD [Chloroflexota bacterium]